MDRLLSARRRSSRASPRSADSSARSAASLRSASARSAASLLAASRSSRRVAPCAASCSVRRRSLVVGPQQLCAVHQPASPQRRGLVLLQWQPSSSSSSSSGLRVASCCGIRQQQPLRVCLDAPLRAQSLLERADGVVQAEVQRGLLARDLSDEQPRQPRLGRCRRWIVIVCAAASEQAGGLGGRRRQPLFGC